MNRGVPSSVTLAGGLLMLTAVGYAVLVALSVGTGRVYLLALGGSEPTAAGSVLLIYGPLAVLAFVIARNVLAGRTGRVVAVAFGAWFVIAAVAVIGIGTVPAAGIALTGLLPLAILWRGRATLRQ
jgi:hypothetical protein